MFSIDPGLTDGWVDGLVQIDTDFPYRKNCFYEAIKKPVLEQNLWWHDTLVELAISPNTVNVYASGFSTYTIPLLYKLGTKNIRLYDYDPEVTEVNWRLNNHYLNKLNIEQHTLDVIFDHEWIDKEVDLVLNTSCENMYHFYKVKAQYKKDVIFCLQGTNKPKKGNINLPKDVDEFIFSTGITDILYQGVYPDSGYDRFMVIGR